MTRLTRQLGFVLFVVWAAGCSSGGKDGGLGGSGGSLPSGISGAPGNFCSTPLPPACGGIVCGNGVRDQCMSAANVGCTAMTVTEACDGTDLGGATCASQGFAGGTLTCTESCGFDLSVCTACLPTGDGVVRCGPAGLGAPGPSRPLWMALAASATEVGLAWTDYDQLYGHWRVGFSRLSPSLDVIATTTFETYDAGELASAPLADGWVVAEVMLEGLVLYTLDAGGQKLARMVVEENPRDPNSWDASVQSPKIQAPKLVARSDGGPLLLWRNADGYRAAIVAADGRSTSAPVNLPNAGVEGFSPAAAAYVEGAFSVVVRVSLDDGLRLVRIGADGHIISSEKILAGQTVGAPDLATGTTDHRLIYEIPGAGTDPAEGRIMFRHLSASGAPTGTAAPFASLGAYRAETAAAGLGDDSLVLLSSSSPEQLALARLDSNGQLVGAIRPLAKAPSGSLHYPLLAKRGPDVIVGWTIGDAISLARVTP
jgi:hypothetical protein